MTPSALPAIILAAFGTSEPSALPALFAVRRRVEAAFPGRAVALAFTSPTVRGIWHARANDAAFKHAHPTIPPEIYSVPDVPAALAAARAAGSVAVLLQSLHIADGAEFAALEQFAQPDLRIGAPALGIGDGGENSLRRAADALAPLAARAIAGDAALVLMAHGNKNLRQTVFTKLEQTLRARFSPRIHIGMVEAPPPAPNIVESVKNAPAAAPANILLAPLMLTAGEHALRDMAGDDPGSWLGRFRAEGFAVECCLDGLGLNPSWADIYVEHLKALEEH